MCRCVRAEVGLCTKNCVNAMSYCPKEAGRRAPLPVRPAAGYDSGLTLLRAIATAIERKTALRNPAMGRSGGGANHCCSALFRP